MLGTALCQELAVAGWRVVDAGHIDCDIRDPTAIRTMIMRARPDVVFNAAGYTEVDRAEGEGLAAFEVNGCGAEHVAAATAEAGIALVHYSTDFVFDGKSSRAYVEDDRAAPLNVYGRTKLAGDEFVRSVAPRHFVVRTGALYGHGGRNFPSTVVARLLAGQLIRADQDRCVSPTWVREVACVSLMLAKTDFYGLYHATAHGETKWIDFARACATGLELPNARIEGATIPYKAARPRRVILDNLALRERGLDAFSSWQDALRGYLDEERGA